MKENKIQNYINENRINVESLLKDYSKYIYTIAKNIDSSLSDEDIEEIIIDTIVVVWKNQDKLIKENDMSPYIAGVSKNLIFKKYRDIEKLEDIEEYKDVIKDFRNIETDIINKESHYKIIEVLSKLKKEDSNIFIEYYYEDKSIKEIANEFNMSESKIKSKLFRIRNKLKKYLRKEGI